VYSRRGQNSTKVSEGDPSEMISVKGRRKRLLKTGKKKDYLLYLSAVCFGVWCWGGGLGFWLVCLFV